VTTKLWSDATRKTTAASENAELRDAVLQTQTARTAEATSISQGSVLVENGADITLDGGGLLAIQNKSRLVVRYPSGGDAAYFGYISDGTEIVAYGILMYDEEGNNLFRVRDHVTNGSQVIVGGLTPAASFEVYAEEIDFRGTEDIGIATSGGFAAFGGSAGTYLQPESTGLAANMHMDVQGRVFRSTSSRRYKDDIQDAAFDPDAVLQLQPRTWLPGSIPRTCPDWLHEKHGGDHCPAEQEPACPDPNARRQVGFVAEELVDLGLSDFVEFNADNEPEAIYYDRLTAALIPVLQRQQEQIDALTEQVKQLVARVAGQEHAPEPNTTRRQP
jgi:hypothetical protein